jgi:hypothetical protein
MANDDLAALIEEVEAGWRVDITNHDYTNDSRDDVEVTEVRDDGVILRPKRPWSSQGRGFSTMHLTWENLEVTGRIARLYIMGTSITSRTTPGVKRLAKTFTFRPPRPY